MLNHYEAAFVLTPVLSEPQMKEAVDKFEKLLAENGGTILARVSYTISYHPDLKMAMSMLDKAFRKTDIPEGLILHSARRITMLGTTKLQTILTARHFARKMIAILFFRRILFSRVLCSGLLPIIFLCHMFFLSVF